MSNINEVNISDINVKPFDPKKKLNPDFFNDEGQLKSQIRMRLLDVADDFVKTLEIKWLKPIDIVLTGSIANYNWTEFSDVDIHIIYKFSDVYKKTDFVKDYFDAKKEQWNQSHDELTIKDFPVEMSVEDADNPAQSTGVYSLEKNKWVKEPENVSDEKLDKEYIKKFCAKKMTELDDLFKEMDNETDRQKLKILSDKVEGVYTELKNMRKKGLASTEKEMSNGNIIWKIVKHAGYIKKLWDYINKVYDRRNTIDEKKGNRIVRLSEAQAKLIKEYGNPGYGNVYLWSWRKRFARELGVDNIEMPQLHNAVQALGAKKMHIPGSNNESAYKRTDLEYILQHKLPELKQLLGLVRKQPTATIVQDRPVNNTYPEEDYSSPASKMDNFIDLPDVSELNESTEMDNMYCDMWDDAEVKPFDILLAYRNKESEVQDWSPLIKPVQYQNALRQYMQYGDAMRFPDSVVEEWIRIILTNTIRLESNTELAGHSQWFPEDDFKDVYDEDFELWCQKNNIEVNYDYEYVSEFLDEIGFYDWLKLPDGSDAWSDFGLKPIMNILSEYSSDMSTGEKLILVNRCLDVVHCRGDLASAFIVGGSSSLTQASNNELFETIHRVNEAAMPQFNLQTLSSIKSFAGRLKYCKQMLGPTFGSGSSRVIFEIDDNKVLKLAKNQKGLAQNEFEEETSRYGSIVVKVFECADDYSWLVEENCLPAKEKDFEQILGMSFETYCDLVKHSFNRYCRNGRQANTYTLSPIECDRLLDQLYEQDEYGFIPRLFDLMGDYQLPWGDLTRISTYGMVNRDGKPQIVVIDSGLSQEIYDTYYG